MYRRYAKPADAEMARAEAMRDGVLKLMQASGTRWLSAMVDGSPVSPAELRGVMTVMRESPIWMCRERCSCPGGAESLGCSQMKQQGEAAGAVIVLHECLLSGGACPGAVRSRARALFTFMRVALTQAAAVKMLGAKESSVTRRAAARGDAALDQSAAMILRMLDSCPGGAMPEEAPKFLAESGFLKELGPFAAQCARNLLAPFRKEHKPASACGPVIDPVRRREAALRGFLRDAPYEPSPARCDGFCNELTCGSRADPAPRLIQFGAAWAMSLPDGACEGAVPVRGRAFAEALLRRRLAKPGALAGAKGQAALGACVRELFPEKDSAPAAAEPATGGPDVQLVE